MHPVVPKSNSFFELSVPRLVVDWAASPSLYVSLSLILTSGFAAHAMREASWFPPLIEQGAMRPADLRYLVLDGAVALHASAIIAYPGILLGSILRARQTRLWRFVGLNIMSGMIWFFGLFSL